MVPSRVSNVMSPLCSRYHGVTACGRAAPRELIAAGQARPSAAAVVIASHSTSASRHSDGSALARRQRQPPREVSIGGQLGLARDVAPNAAAGIRTIPSDNAVVSRE